MENYKKIIGYSLSSFFLVITLVVIYSVFWGPAAKWSNSFSPARTLSVSGTGKVYITPDVASVSFSVVSEGANINAIINENNSKINEAINFVKSQGVSDKDIKTTLYNLLPVYSQKTESSIEFIPRIVKYSLTQTVSLKIRDFSKISEILGKLPSLGINSLGDLSFVVDNPEKYLSDARKDAIKDALEKAKNILSQSGMSLGKIVNISEYSGYYPSYYRGGLLGAGGGEVTQVNPSVEPGSQELSINVNINYEIR